MRYLAIILLVAALMGAQAQAGEENDVCGEAEHLAFGEGRLPHVASAIESAHQLKIGVIGTSSSMLPGARGSQLAYPARLEAALRGRMPEIKVSVTNFAKPRQTTADMVKQLEPILNDLKPALIVWQTGTVDAVRSADPDEFRAALEQGVALIRKQGADVILVNMQYSPRTESMIALGPYADAMRLVAIQDEVPLFDRFATMKHWNELGTFDLYHATNQLDVAEQVHDCIGRLLAALIVDALKTVETGSKDLR
jgi:hypothetical protein